MQVNPIILSLAIMIIFITGCATRNPNIQLTMPGNGVIVNKSSSLRHILPARDPENAAKKEYEKIKEKPK